MYKLFSTPRQLLSEGIAHLNLPPPLTYELDLLCLFYLLDTFINNGQV